MIIVRNRLVGFLLTGHYSAMCIWPFLFVSPGNDVSEHSVILNHERIHARQQLEMLWLFFFMWYGAEYFARLLYCRNHYKAYRTLSFEQEAFTHDEDRDYLKKRKVYAWVKFL